MTTDRDFKRLVRKRMAETGESYTVARSHFEQVPKTHEIDGISSGSLTLSGFKRDVYARPRVKDVARHLEAAYGIGLSGMTELDLGVFRVDRQKASSWVARVFPPVRTIGSARGDAEILEFLEQMGFPAESVARPDAVTLMGRRPVLVTKFIPGANRREDATEETMHELGEMLGKLHSISDDRVERIRAGGSWHHLTVNGGGRRKDVEILAALISDAARRLPAEERSLISKVQEDLEALKDFEDLPHALAHPDPCSANLLTIEGNGSVLVDWTGAGRAPRLMSFANMIGSSTNLAHIEAAVSGYCKHISMSSDELANLEEALVAFPFILDCWYFLFQDGPLQTLVRRLSVHRDRAEVIAERVRSASGASTATVHQPNELVGQERLF